MSMLRRWWLAAMLAAAFPVSAATAGDSPSRTVAVSGEGVVSAEPDLARISLGIESRKPALADARAEVAATVDRVLALTRSLRVDPKLVNATRLRVQPDYSWNDKERKRVLLGYVVSRQVEVELRDLEQLGPLLERAVDAGVNQIGDPQLDSSRRNDLEREAMTKAVQDARLNAETLARAAGARLGAVRVLNGQSNSPPVPVFRSRGVAMAADAAPAETYQTGDMKFSASVAAEYDLLVAP
jgi:uncharacterized protein